MTAIVGPPSATERGIRAVRPARPRSARNIIRLRSLRSASAPATIPRNRSGSVWRAPTMPIATPEPVSARTSSGRAVKLTASPSEDTPWLVRRTLKSRFCASGWAAGASSMVRMVREAPVCEALAGRWPRRRMCSWTPSRARSTPSSGPGDGSAPAASSPPGRATCRSASMPTGCWSPRPVVRKDELTPDDLVIVWLDHPERDAVSRSGLGPTSDLAIHLAVHAARPDVTAVVHAHLPASMALTLAGEVPDPARPARRRPSSCPASPSSRSASRAATSWRRGSRPRSRSRPSRWPRPSCSSGTGRSRSGATRTTPSTGSSSSRSCAGRGATRS